VAGGVQLGRRFRIENLSVAGMEKEKRAWIT